MTIPVKLELVGGRHRPRQRKQARTSNRVPTTTESPAWSLTIAGGPHVDGLGDRGPASRRGLKKTASSA
jgi:hypothetical protein